MMKIINTIVKDKTMIVNGLNKHFTEIGSSLASKIPPTTTDSCSFLPPSNPSTIGLPFTIHSEIANIISNLKNTSSCSFDEISVNVIKEVKEYISPVLSLLVSQSIQQGIFPNALKIAKIKPLLKSGDPCLMSNYRPVSILNSFSKVYERVLCNRFENFI